MTEQITTMGELAAWVDDEGGVASVTLGKLRDAVEADKLGKLVMGRIGQDLAAHGLGYFPRDVIDSNPVPRQHHQVRIYRKGSSASARAIEAVLYPSATGDKFLNELGGDQAQDVLARVRELVCADV